MNYKKIKWLVLDHVGNFNGRSFSILVNPKDARFYYDILDLNYVLSVKVYWFASFNKRRESEQISVMSSFISIIKPIDEIVKLPYFQRYITKTSEEEFPKKVADTINGDKDLLGALILKYQNELGESIYQGTAKIITDYDRFSSYKELATKFIATYTNSEEYDTSEIREETIGYCIV